MWLRNCWQVIAFAREIGNAPLARTVCGEEIVLFRTQSGKAAALADRCPHRFAPLSLGRVSGEQIQCGYHGMCFDAEGRCVRVPGQDTVPRQARVRNYPLVERHALRLDLAGRRGARRSRHRSRTCIGASIRPGRCADGYHHFAPTTSWSTTTCSTSRTRASCMRTRSATRRSPKRRSPSASTATACACTATCTTWKRRRSTSAPPASPAASTAGTPTPSRRRACTSSRTARCRRARRTRAPRSNARCSTSITPETTTTTHYFWAIVRQFKIDDQALTDYIRDGIAKTFDQDKTVLEAQQRIIGGDPDRAVFPVSIRVDAAPIQGRKLLAAMIARETGASAPLASARG